MRAVFYLAHMVLFRNLKQHFKIMRVQIKLWSLLTIRGGLPQAPPTPPSCQNQEAEEGSALSSVPTARPGQMPGAAAFTLLFSLSRNIFSMCTSVYQKQRNESQAKSGWDSFSYPCCCHPWHYLLGPEA